MQQRRGEIANVLRQQLARAIAAGSLQPGDRLPSTRELAVELRADPRVIAAAYRMLASEGIVELRPRSGIFYSGTARSAREPSPEWMVDALTAAVDMGIPLPSVAGWVRRATLSRTVNAAVVAPTIDQSSGLCRELRDDYGIDSQSVDPAELDGEFGARRSLPRAIRRAHLLVSTGPDSARVQRIAEAFGLRHVRASIRSDLLGFEWQQLMLRPAYFVVVDKRFIPFVRAYFRDTPGASNVRFLVVGEHDLGVIPSDAPTYITQAARARLNRRQLPGFVLPPARFLARDCGQAIVECIVAINRGDG